ncbi:MAG: dTDP-glucose 4,6-dehydratase [Porphyromonas sp.]|nr:dTDP-glucose 4,6-dehydratase [Porphyromonas sp.]
MKKTFEKTILVTGGAGFIGSNFLLRMVPRYPSYHFVNIDALTYAGILANLKELEGAPNYAFRHIDIVESQAVRALFEEYPITHVVHFAAESHVDRSIHDPLAFVRTNVLGTVNLLQNAQRAWSNDYEGKRFFHVSTDEVYGSLKPEDAAFGEQHRYEPHSPYSASKASADHFVRAYHDTYGLPILISNCSNNYGPYQFPEKLIPLCINNIVHQRPLPIYGDGTQVRDWLFVADHVDAIDTILHKGREGETYNVGGCNEVQNIELVRQLISIVDQKLGHPEGHSLGLITYVTDRPGHDTRYAIDATKIHEELGWQPAYSPEEGFEETVEWYLAHQEWLDYVTSGDYQNYYDEMYGERLR